MFENMRGCGERFQAEYNVAFRPQFKARCVIQAQCHLQPTQQSSVMPPLSVIFSGLKTERTLRADSAGKHQSA